MTRFLVIDDDAACRRLLSTILSSHGRCDTAFDGREGVGAFRMALDAAEPYDLICLDIMMPELDGHATLAAIRKIEHDQGILGSDGVKVIMTTALRDPKHCIQSFREGCESYLTKPIREAELLGQIKALLGVLTAKISADETPVDGPPSRRYLIVDDDGVCRELLKDILSSHAQCDMAYDGLEAIDAVRLALEDGVPYDLVCLDIMMPGASGHEALTAIRKIEAERGVYGSDGVKVIMTTALRDAKHCVQSFREGCESYVTKPIDEEELLGRMRELDLLPATV